MNGFSTWNRTFRRHLGQKWKNCVQNVFMKMTHLIITTFTRCNKLEMWSQSALTLDWVTKSSPGLPENHFQPFLWFTRKTCEVILGTDVSFCEGKFSELRHAEDECAWHLTLEIFSIKKGSQRTDHVPDCETGTSPKWFQEQQSSLCVKLLRNKHSNQKTPFTW